MTGSFGQEAIHHYEVAGAEVLGDEEAKAWQVYPSDAPAEQTNETVAGLMIAKEEVRRTAGQVEQEHTVTEHTVGEAVASIAGDAGEVYTVAIEVVVGIVVVE